MTTIHISVDDQAAQAIEEKARLAGKTTEAWAAEVLVQQAAPVNDKSWMQKVLDNAKESPGHSGGWKFNREELYER